ncbi:hypothetical protein [Consotaella salsifontis]|uniref:Lipoprotein n=1 Tax=Consotaella salsifontis TaxID=1365950 RepID=A0A1T4SS75_9HYPH|nr:hypothetical protein [Consotaella salsifontis]SKA31006.1 hypothetical protein SAMN05428963_11399 [Consotaella salsifontis]
MKKQIIALVALAATVSSCAKRPDAIVPVEVPMAAYGNLECKQLAQEYMKEQGALTSLSKQQNDAASGDAFGVFLLGVPVSSAFGGDKEGQVAIAKGKVNAIESTMKAKSCSTAG